MDAILHLQGACILKELPLPTLQRHMPYLAFFESFQLRGPRGKARKKRGDKPPGLQVVKLATHLGPPQGCKVRK